MNYTCPKTGFKIKPCQLFKGQTNIYDSNGHRVSSSLIMIPPEEQISKAISDWYRFSYDAWVERKEEMNQAEERSSDKMTYQQMRKVEKWLPSLPVERPTNGNVSGSLFVYCLCQLPDAHRIKNKITPAAA